MNIKEAVNQVKNSENLLTSLLPFVVITTVSTIYTSMLKEITQFKLLNNQIMLLLGIVIIILMLLQSGYQILVLRNHMLYKPEILPSFKEEYKSMLILGIKYLSAICIYMLIPYICLVIGLVIPKTNPLVNIFLLVGSLVLFISAILIFPALTIIFASKNKFSSFFNFKQIFELIKSNPVNYFKTFGILFLLGLPIVILPLLLKNYLLIESALSGIYSALYGIIWAIYFGEVFKSFVKEHMLPEENTLA